MEQAGGHWSNTTRPRLHGFVEVLSNLRTIFKNLDLQAGHQAYRQTPSSWWTTRLQSEDRQMATPGIKSYLLYLPPGLGLKETAYGR